MIVADLQFSCRTQHPVGPLATQLAPFNEQAIGHGGAQRSQRNSITHAEVPRTTGNLRDGRATFGSTHINQADLVGIGVGTDGHHFSGDDGPESPTGDMHALHLQAKRIERIAELGDAVVERHEVAQP